MFDSLTTVDLIAPGLIVSCTGCIFVSMLVAAVGMWWRVASARRWPVVQGTVLESLVIEARDSGGGHYTYPQVTYRYAVDGQVYKNSAIYFGEHSSKSGTDKAKQRARDTVARYVPGSPVSVYYHPQKPGTSVLEIRESASKFMLIGGGIFLLAGLVVASVVMIIAMMS